MPVWAGAPVPGKNAALRSTGLRFAVPQHYVLDDLDNHVAADFDRALKILRDRGAQIASIPLETLSILPDLMATGGLIAPEAYAVHRDLMARHGAGYDPRVLVRIQRGQHQLAADYVDVLRARKHFIATMRRELDGFDALLMPTVPIIAPTIESLEAR